MRIYAASEYPQASDAWWQLRSGIPTACGFDRIITAVQAKASAQQDDYIAELLADINSLTPPYFTGQGHPVNTYAMQNGKDVEPEARSWYAMEREGAGMINVEEVGFIMSDCGRFGCSPDGLVYEAGELRGGIELKCPLKKTQVKYLIDGTLPNEYKAQVHGGLLVTGLPWWDFLSYAPGLDPLLIRVVPDEFTERLRDELEKFLVKYAAAMDRVYPERRAVQETEKAFADWIGRVGKDLDAFNAGLQELSGLSHERKKAAWRLCLAHAESLGWTFDREAKVFRVLAPAPF